LSGKVLIRAVRPSDIECLARLNEQLGYDSDPTRMKVHLKQVAQDPFHHLVVAAHEDVVVGFAHCFERPSVEKGLDLVVQSLVVNSDLRRTGIGRTLMAEVERLAAEKSCERVVLSSRIDRAEAHQFYQKLGYEIVATSVLLAKAVW
jgi:ribosomal protein S18 acetylase RimI-like enzyme